jgi:Fuc2NAc and GlcNAc transferase
VTISDLGWPVSAALLTWLLTGVVDRYARAHALLDVPNTRSLHQVPTPRGGGLAITIVALGGALMLGLFDQLASDVVAAVVGGGLVAWVGWRDDRAHVAPAIRAAVHGLAAGWAVYRLGGMPHLTVGASRFALGGAGAVLAILAIVWCINLYNFMDGIDGLSGVEGVSVALPAGAMLLSRGEHGLGLFALIVGGASAGFLVWNWSPARIFMGDVGSGFLGFVFGVLTLAAERSGALPGLIVLLLLSVFLVDATLTLARRVAAGERWYSAHRRHAYQRAVQAGHSHRQVAMAVVGMNVVLAALGWWACREPVRLGYLVLGGLALVSALYVAVERLKPMYGAD